MLLVAWPIVFGLTLTLLRLLILARFGEGGLSAGDAIGLAGQVAVGLVLALPLHLLGRSRARWPLYPLLAAVVMVNVAAFHYEAVFSRLPGVNLVYYLREAVHLGSSAARHAPLWALITEVVVTSALLIAAAEVLGRRERVPPLLAAVCLASVAATLAAWAKPAWVPRSVMWRSRTPLLWAAQSWSAQRSYAGRAATVDRRQVLGFQRMLGHRVPFGGVDPRYPLCGDRGAAATANGRSVIFLILESIASEEMKAMPALQRIAAQGLSFRDVKAGGTKSLQAMPALFAGVPPQPAGHLLWREPLNHLEGFPLTLRQQGYRTAYFHGGDLSFEQQRPFLRMVGFEDIVELDPAERLPLYGWGYSDDVMFGKMQRWIESHRSAPYLAALFTLSTHDPYVIPNARAGPNLRAAFQESLRFLDQQLARFYEWYLRHEAPRGTILVITGDHAPHLAGDRHIEDDEVTRFDVPLVILGAQRGVSPAPAAHFDLPATILGLTGLPPGPCDQGLDLLAPSPAQDRVRFAVAGDQLEDFHFWSGGAHVQLDLVRGDGRVKVARPASPEAAVAAMKSARDVYGLTRNLSAYLVQEDAFAPPPVTVRLDRRPLPRVVRPVFVAHRGQSRGELPAAEQNTRKAIAQALADGFEWIEIDVNVTSDSVPVVIHDDVSAMTLGQLRAKLPETMTLEEAITAFGDEAGLRIELKPQKTLGANSVLAMKVSLLVREHLRPERVVIDSYLPFLASSAERHCRCPVGIDAPARPLDSRWIDNAVLNGLEWIYIDHRQASPELIAYAHGRGIRVLVFTVNDVAEIERLKGEWPDAVITDRAELVRTFDARFRAR